MEWLESFLKSFSGMYDVIFTVDYSEENLEKFKRLFECFTRYEERGITFFNLGTCIDVDEEKSMIHVKTLGSNIKKMNFWNEYELFFQHNKNEYLKEISKLICEIKEAGYSMPDMA